MRNLLRALALTCAGGVALMLVLPGLRAATDPPRIATTATARPASVLLPLITVCPPEKSGCDATPTETPRPPAAPTPSATPGPTPTQTAGKPGVTRVAVGAQGFSDVGTHQVVRTSADRVYIFAPEIYKSYIRALRATSAGTPAGFAEADQADRPAAQSPIWSVDAAIDANDVVHLLYIAQDGPVVYQTFDTRSDRWGAAATVTSSAWPNRENGLRQGSAGVSLALDASGVAHVAYGKAQGSLRRVYYNNNAGGSWSHEALLDDQPNSDNSHATLAFAPDGALYAAWLADDGAKAAIRVRAFKNGAWTPASPVDDNVFRDNQYSIDQGPSLLVAPNGRIHIAYIGPWEPVAGSPSGTDYGRLRHKHSADGASWTADDPPLRDTHDPALATDAQSNIYVFGHREYWKAERCADMLVIAQPAGAGWGAWKTLDAGCFDSSVSVRWSQYNWRAPDVLDLVYWTEKGPQGQSDTNLLQYAEIRGGPQVIGGLGAGR